MNSSLLRMIAGYSRFALQEERKHDMRTGVFMVKNLPLLPYQRINYLNHPIRSVNIETLQQPQSHKLSIPNLSLQVSQHNNKVTVIGHLLDQRTENQINTIQYQANNGIQDRLVATTLRSLDAQTISVFDGHGGDKLSDYCANQIVELIDSFIQKNKNQEIYSHHTDRLITDALKYSYNKLDTDFYQNVYKALVATNNRKIKNIGTCALTIILYDRKIYVANCGDSQAIVVAKDKLNKISYVSLNQRLSVNNPAERDRLKKQFPHDQDIVVEEQNGCFYIKGRLQPTRALGDYHLKHEHLFKGKGKFHGPYIKGEPDVKIFPIKDEYKSIVVASDGVWDFLSKNVVAEASLQYHPHQAILEKTLDRIAQIHKRSVDEIKQVSSAQKRAFHDDISIAVVSLGKTNKTDQVL